ncbi:hypothetical protein F441_10807 [Phytophthora nicotianae CJ01A1]|uniref:Uncharacterized protein n=6 Tax=Phytophthora nicotianae TaxID=4792 RepID=W2Q6Z6_PHYN3|nr:hypothetical protein PPTG_23127 [Phytophthora nicotianae INRA-310]ETI44413.1 hypothetical protein F443_10881 [Phytophthora nicotianae P1569]ETK84422.1 hypothetical protein L915_10617 [Phytophthora nicotianae]ETO73085.1 hypothetical protein F444_10941 [Phytophthora nicotianae P1976]ETP14216.1 hypothetical protein F441_10807 [Phytophthora nicotianae CJ01A1]ETP42292.1 hypothetical protein F442_10786 [Phytophthora nicotianae P10297]
MSGVCKNSSRTFCAYVYQFTVCDFNRLTCTVAQPKSKLPLSPPPTWPC